MDLNDIFCLCTMHFIKSTEQRGILSFVLFSLTVDKRGIQHLVYILKNLTQHLKKGEKYLKYFLLPSYPQHLYCIFLFLFFFSCPFSTFLSIRPAVVSVTCMVLARKCRLLSHWELDMLGIKSFLTSSVCPAFVCV